MTEIFHTIFTSTIAISKKYPLIVIFATVGLMFFIYGLISLLASNSTDSAIIFEEDSTDFRQGLNSTASASHRSIFVDVEGAVVHPGVYRIDGDPRLKDALIAASGLSSDADRSWVAKNLNLAQKLTDGAKVYVPNKSQSANLKTQNYSGSDISNSSSQININTASISELEALPGIGKVTAQKIVDNKPYSDIQELLSKKVVGNAVFEKIKDRIIVY